MFVFQCPSRSLRLLQGLLKCAQLYGCCCWPDESYTRAWYVNMGSTLIVYDSPKCIICPHGLGNLYVSFLTTTSPLAVARCLRSSVLRSGSYAVGAYILSLRVILTFFRAFPIP